mgnify:FL=1
MQIIEPNNNLQKAIINDNAIDTWLEPYIGYVVYIISIKSNVVAFKFDDDEIHSHDFELFNIQPNTTLTNE